MDVCVRNCNQSIACAPSVDLRILRRFLVALLIQATLGETARAGAADTTNPDAYQPTHSILHRIVHVTVNEDGTVQVVSDLARRADTARGVRVLGEDRIRFRETMMRVEVTEAWSVTPDGRRIEVPIDAVRIKDDDDGDGDSDNKLATVIFPGLELGSTVHRVSRSVHHTMPYPGHISMSFYSAQRLRVDRYEINIAHPAKIPLQVRADRFEGGRIDPRSDDGDGMIRYRFTIAHREFFPRQTAELDIDDWAPSVLISTFSDYATLASAYHRRAAPRAEPDEDIHKLAHEVTRGAGDDRERVARIRDWVNRNIRYLSVHFGLEGWIPHPAPQMLKTRYGDCKDQTAFMQAMLRAVGIDSTPALVNTGSTYQLPKLPIAGAFDHVIVYVPSLDLFVDPTDRYAALGALPEMLYGKPALLTATGEIVRLPVVSPDRDYVETTTHMRVDEEGRVFGTTRVLVAGAEEGGSRRAQHAAQSGPMEDRINDILQRFDESGTGRIWSNDPLVHGDPWVVKADFELEPVVKLPGPAAMRIPVGVTRADLRGIANWRPLSNRRNPFECHSGRWRENIEIELPVTANIAYIPTGSVAESGAFRFRSEWRWAAGRLRVVRELIIQRDRGYCLPHEDRDFVAVRDVIRRDLLGQVIFGVAQ